MKIIACQHGRRHRYAIPGILEEAGMLSAFYTDSSAYSKLGKIFSGTRSFSERTIDGVPKEKIYSSDYPLLIERIERLKGTRGIHLHEKRHQALSKAMIKWGLRDAGWLYSMYHENLDFVNWAHMRGAKIIIDVFISPKTDAIVHDVARLHPKWEDTPDHDEIDLAETLWQKTSSIADILLCPSEWVADGVKETCEDVADKIRVVPYGCSFDYEGISNSPIEGRVLFAGTNALRKGIGYLAEAATALKSKNRSLEIRIAGQHPHTVTSDPVCKDLHFLGKLNAEHMKEEYLKADVFILPSLSEGFASVVPEAIGAGCPVIVTKESGTPVVHEREGLVIPSHDAKAITNAIIKVTGDRSLRSRLAENCKEQASFYSREAWSKRLIQAISGNNSQP